MKSSSVLFSGGLPQPGNRSKSFAASWTLQIAVLALLLLLKLAAPAVLDSSKGKEVLTWMAPPPEPVPVEVIKPAPAIPIPTPPPMVVVQPKPAPVVAPTPPEFAEIKVTPPAPVLPMKAVVVKPIPQVGKFEEPPPVSKPVVHTQDVATGGFGDPEGIRGHSKTEPRLVAASYGSFDAAHGPGTGGRQNRTVTGSGFSEATPAAAPVVSRQGVQNGGFGEATAGQPSAPARRAVVAKGTPVEIVFKPAPVYTQDARALHLEGEVLLNVLFPATGKPRVLGLVRGLGHGLDEAATTCAEAIRFKPARTAEGQDIDSVAMLHVVFQMAN